MIELKILLDEIDYDTLADVLVPLVAQKLRKNEKSGILVGMLAKNPAAATAMAHTLLKTMSQEKRDELLVQLVTGHREELLEKGRELLQGHGIKLELCDIAAREV